MVTARSADLDSGFPAHERFPRRITFALVPFGKTTCHVYVEPAHGPLRCVHTGAEDLGSEGDGYRWSHVFNFAYMSILGWSPVARALLGLKRRTQRKFEKAEDGARAQMMEEAMSALLFNEAQSHGFYKNAEAIPAFLIDEVCWIAQHYEAKKLGVADWRLAIQRGYEVWKSVRESNGGFVDLNLDARTIRFRPLPSDVPEAQVVGSVQRTPSVASYTDVLPHPLDIRFPDQERFPRRATFMLVETKKNVAEMFLELSNGGYVNIGSKAEEWSHGDDGFRWHDVFHLANAAVLGWSPVVRTLLGLERKSDPTFCAREDGLRAQIAEEALAVLVFGRAQESGWFECGKLPTVVRWYIEKLMSHYEVLRVPVGLWEKAILDGFHVWRTVRRSGGGLIDVDFVSRSISSRPLPLFNDSPER